MSRCSDNGSESFRDTAYNRRDADETTSISSKQEGLANECTCCREFFRLASRCICPEAIVPRLNGFLCNVFSVRTGVLTFSVFHFIFVALLTGLEYSPFWDAYNRVPVINDLGVEGGIFRWMGFCYGGLLLVIVCFGFYGAYTYKKSMVMAYAWIFGPITSILWLIINIGILSQGDVFSKRWYLLFLWFLWTILSWWLFVLCHNF